MPVRILHTADIHLGVESYGRTDPETGLNSRLTDFTRSFDVVVDHALTGGVDAFVFAGDAYRSRDPNPTHQREFALRVRRLAEAGVQVFLLAGNHDIPNAFGRATSLEIFSTLAVPNVTVARQTGIHRLVTMNGPLNILALPWITRSGFLAAEELKGKTLEEINELVGALVAKFIQDKCAALPPDEPAILVAHCGVLGAQGGSERARVLGQEMALPLSVVADPRLSYVALGHIHRRQILQSQNPPVIYAGSIERVDFSEETEDKGFVIADVSPRGCTFEMADLPARRFLTIEVDARSDQPLAEVARQVEAQPLADAVVRLLVKATRDSASLLPTNELRRLLRDAHYSTISIETESERRRAGGAAFAEAMSPRQALERFLELKQTAPDRRQRLLEYGDRLASSPATVT